MTKRLRKWSRFRFPLLDYRSGVLLAGLAVLLALKFVMADDLRRRLFQKPVFEGRPFWMELVLPNQPSRLYGFSEPIRIHRIYEALGVKPPVEAGELAFDRPVRLALDARGHYRIMPLSGPAAMTLTGRIDLNTALFRDLTMLDGIGPKTAGAILREREENGRFRDVNDLVRVKGIGSIRLENLRKTERLSVEQPFFRKSESPPRS